MLALISKIKKSIKTIAMFIVTITVLCLPSVGFANNQDKEIIEMDMADQVISITTSFTGNNFKVHGATDIEGTIILTVTGDNQKYILSQKQNILGMWMDKVVAYVVRAPSYYALISSSPVNIDRYSDVLNIIGINNLYYDINPVNTNLSKTQLWKNVMHLNQKSKRYIYQPYGVKKIGKYLFNATIHFPSEIPSGIYKVDGYVADNGVLKGFFQTSLYVGRDGLTKFVYLSARDYSVWYGIFVILLSLSIGFSVGWYRN